MLLELELRRGERAAAGAGLAAVLLNSCGLYSNVSCCDIAPFMKTKMSRLAFAVKCGAFGASGFGAAVGGAGLLAEQPGEGEVAEAGAGGLQRLTARDWSGAWVSMCGIRYRLG